MGSNRNYIGLPNGAVLCVDRIENGSFDGRLYHRLTNGIKVNNPIRLVDELEVLMDRMNYPRPTTDTRTFIDEQSEPGNAYAQTGKPDYVMTDEDLLSVKGDKATFIIRVQQRQNSTWQGRITWCDKEKTIVFHSMWEMLKLLENAMYADGRPEESPEPTSWEDPE